MACGVCLLLAVGSIDSSTQAADTGAPPPSARSRQLTDDALAPLAPRQQRTPQDELRLRAVSNFATGRLYERRQDFPTALRHYQRAVRYDPSASMALRHVVDIGQQLNRFHLAARYAVLLAERDPSDALTVLRGIVYLSATEQDERALRLYEAAMSSGKEKNEIWFELHKMAGGIYHRQQQREQAAQAFARVNAAMKNPESYQLDDQARRHLDEAAQAIYLIMSDAFLAAGHLDEALVAVDQARQHRADRDYATYLEARILARQKKFAAAGKKLSAYIESDSQEAGLAAYRLLADVLEAQGEGDHLIEMLQRRFSRHADNVSLGNFLADQYEAAGEPAKATELVERLMQIQPNVEGYRRLATAYRNKKKPDKLLQLLGDLAQQADSLEPLGEELKKLAADAATGDALFAAARKLDTAPLSQAFGPWLAMGMLAAEAKQLDVASEFYGRIFDSTHPERAAVLMSRGLDLVVAEQYTEASRILQRGLDEKLFLGKTAIVDYYLAGALAMEKRFDDAIAAARRAVAASPDPAGAAEARMRLAWVLSRSEHIEEAQQAYEGLLEEFAGDHSSLERRQLVRDVRMSLSQLHALQGDFTRGAELLEQVLDEYPEDAGAKNDLAYLWAEQSTELFLAERLSRDALKTEPTSAAYRDTLGWVLYRLGQYEEAAAELQRAVELLKDPDGVVYDHLGDALQKAGRGSEAVERWTAAVAAFDKSGSDTDKKKLVEAKIAEYRSSN